MLFTHLLRVRDVFNIDVFVVIVFFFCLHILFATVLLTFRLLNFVLCVGSRQTKNLFDLLSYFFSPSVFFCQFCMDVAVVFPLFLLETVSSSFFSVAIYSHENECLVRLLFSNLL